MTRSPPVVLSDEMESPELLATAIISISDGMTALLKSGLNRKAIVVLLADSSKVSRREINLVLNSLANLKKDYCK